MKSLLRNGASVVVRDNPSEKIEFMVQDGILLTKYRDYRTQQIVGPVEAHPFQIYKGRDILDWDTSSRCGMNEYHNVMEFITEMDRIMATDEFKTQMETLLAGK